MGLVFEDGNSNGVGGRQEEGEEEEEEGTGGDPAEDNSMEANGRGRGFSSFVTFA